MKKRTIIYIACAVAIALIIAFAIYFAVKSNKSKNAVNEPKIIITKYNDNFEVEKTIEITDKKEAKEINRICENLSLDQGEQYGIRNDIKLDLGNGKLLIIQEDLKEYCYYEDMNSNTKLVIKIPEGLLEKINGVLSVN